jgi:hypothetical protein
MYFYSIGGAVLFGSMINTSITGNSYIDTALSLGVKATIFFMLMAGVDWQDYKDSPIEKTARLAERKYVRTRDKYKDMITVKLNI